MSAHRARKSWRALPPWLLLLAALLLAAACQSGGSGGGSAQESGCPGFNGPFADRVVDYAPVNTYSATSVQWPYFFNPGLVRGAPGCTFDVASLGYDPTPPIPPDPGMLGGSLTVGLGTGGASSTPVCAVDGAGDDLAVFENPFPHTDPGSGLEGTSNEFAVVSVSEDNATWHEFPHTLNACANPVLASCYTGFAGVTPTAQGGDRFDLADVIAAYGLPAGFQACYVRLTDGGTLYADYGNTQSDLWASGADIDAVQALHYTAAPALTP